MFTGIVQAVGRIRSMEPRGGDLRLTVETGGLDLAGVAVGDSIAVSGACLTAVALEPGAFAADVSRETLDKTILGELGQGSPVNLERALRAGDALGGHYVTGHVDGLARVVDLREDARSWRVRLEVPAELARYVAPKGSATVDGVSLTVNEVEGRVFGVNLIPHTLEVTTLGSLAPGRLVNLEVDIIARYVERLMAAGPASGVQ
jgi:riboflavin synthase